MTETERLFKVLGPAGEAVHGGTGVWHLPKGNRPGKWMPNIEPIAACSRGYHVCTLAQLLRWLGSSIWEVEVRGDRIDTDDKIVVAQARLIRRLPWNERVARSFAADCAERVLPIFEKEHPADSRCRDAIIVARRYVAGAAFRAELDAARAAAWDAAQAARDAAQAAAGAAARAAAWDAAQAARAAARAAARDAARAAARDAARDAAWEWQANRLAHYLGLNQ